WIPPVGREIERVAETVAGPDIRAELIIEITQCRQRVFRCEWHRTACGGGSDRSVIVQPRRSAPRDVREKSRGPRPVARGESPEIRSVTDEPARVCDGISALRQCCAA